MGHYQIVIGAIAMACMVAGLFFLRDWRKTRDRFFLFFSISFFIEGVNRIILGLISRPDEHVPVIYLIRFFSFLLIILAIIDKNLIARKE